MSISNIPQRRFAEFTDPWQFERIENIGRVIRGSSPRPKGDPRYYKGPVPRLMVQDVTRDGKWVTPSIDSLTEEGAKLSRPCKAGTLTIVCSGTVGIVSFLAIDACIHDGFIALVDIAGDGIEKDFLYHQLSTLREQFEKGATHGGVFTNLTTGGVKEFEFLFPTLPEQKKIADFLTSVDDRIGQLIKKKALLEDYKKGVMQQLFSQQIRFKDDNGNDFPDWEEKKLGEVLKIGSGKDYKHLGKGDVPVYGSGGLMTHVDSYLYEGESVGIGRKGTIDKPRFFEGAFWTVDTLFYTHSFERVLPKFIYFVFKRINWRAYNEAGGVPSLSKSTIEKIPLLIPTLNEQKKIADFLSVIDQKIESVSQQIAKTQTFKKGLLQQMFV